MRVEPKVVRYVSGIATALLGSGGFSTVYFPFFFSINMLFYILLMFTYGLRVLYDPYVGDIYTFTALDKFVCVML